MIRVPSLFQGCTSNSIAFPGFAEPHPGLQSVSPLGLKPETDDLSQGSQSLTLGYSPSALRALNQAIADSYAAVPFWA